MNGSWTMQRQLTRREFLQLGSSAFTAGVLHPTSQSSFSASTSEPGSLSGKIALEEHFDLPETAKSRSSFASFGGPEFQHRIIDLGSGRIAEMDRSGVDVCILSLVGHGIQAILDTSQAVEVARRANDHLAEGISKNPQRLRGFAALPLQDPNAAALELTRCVKEFRFCGALVQWVYAGWRCGVSDVL